MQRRSALSIHPYATDRAEFDRPTAAGVVSRVEAAQALVELCQSRLAETKDPAKRARLHYECARLLECPIEDLEQATKEYRLAFAAAADHEPTIAGLRRVLLARRMFADALPLFDAQLRLTARPEDKAALLYEKGRLLEDLLEKKAEARAAYETALELAPSDSALLRAVARCQRRAHAWSDLNETVERQSQVAERDTGLRAARIAERARLTEIHQADSALATELFQKAFDTDPGASGALRDLQRLHEGHQRHRDLIGALEAQVRASTDVSVQATTLYRVARIYADRLGDLRGAIDALERAAQLQPGSVLVLEELARLYQRAQDHAALAGVYERLAAVSTDRWVQLDWTTKLAELAEQRLEDGGRAIEWYERALAIDPTHLPALQALTKLYSQGQLWAQLVALLLREANHALDPLRRAASYQRIAEIYERQLGDREQAIAQYARALGVAPGYEPAFRALDRLYTETQRFRELVELYERAVELASDTEVKLTYLFKIGRLFEDALNAPHQAVHAYKRILEIDKGSLAALHAIQRAAERSGEWKVLVESLVHEAGLLDDSKRKVQLLHRAGEVSEDLLRDDDAALAQYRSVLGLEPRYAPALTSLARIHLRAGRWEDLLDVYRKELGISGQGEQRAAILHRMGRLCEEQLGKEEEALDHYRRAVEAHAGHTAALHDYERLLGTAGRDKELVQVLEGELQRTEEPETRARLAQRIAEVYESKLEQLDKALRAYGQALEASPGLRQALDGRARLLSRMGQYQALAAELEKEAEASKDMAMRITARMRAGDVCRDDLKDIPRAIANFEAVLADNPAHVGALMALESLYAEVGQTEELKRILRAQANTLVDISAQIAALRELVRLDEQAGGAPWSECQAILVRAPMDRRALEIAERLALRGEQPQGIESSQALAELDAQLANVSQPLLAAAYDTRLAEYFESIDPVRSLDRYRSALAKDPDNVAAARGLSRVAEAVGDPLLLEEAAQAEARVTGDMQRAGRLLERAAELRRSRGDVAGAAAALEKALEIHPDRLSAAGALTELLVAQQEIDRLIGSLTSAAQRAQDVDRGARHWIAVAGLYAEHKNDLPAALTALGRVEKKLPDHVPVLLELADLYCRDSQWTQAASRLERVLAARPEDNIVVAASLRLAELLHERLERLDDARAALTTVLDKQPDHVEALRRLLVLQLAMKDGGAMETARRLAQVSTEPQVRAQAWATLGRLLRDAKNVDEACAAYAEAIRIEGIAGSAGRELKELLIQQKLAGAPSAWDVYAGALAQFTSSPHVSSEAFGPAILELARVQADELDQLDASIATLDRGLAANPADPALRIELAGRLRRGGRLERALEELQKLLDLDSLRLETWRDLHEVFDRLGRNPEAHLTLGPLLLLDGATDLQRATWASRQPRTWHLAELSFDESTLAEFDVLSRQRAACALVGQLAEGLSKIYSPTLERFGLTTRDRIGSRSGHVLRSVADRVARLFGVDDFDLYLASEFDGPLAVVLTDPVGIVLPASFASRPEVEQVFLLARPFANLVRGLSAADALSPADLSLLLAAAARMVDPTFGSGRFDEANLESMARRVSKSVSWLSRGKVEDAARAYLAEGPVEGAELSLRARLSAARAALLVADDVVSSVQVVRHTEGDLSGLKPPQTDVAVRMIRDMVYFWVSETALRVRRQVGIL